MPCLFLLLHLAPGFLRPVTVVMMAAHTAQHDFLSADRAVDFVAMFFDTPHQSAFCVTMGAILSHKVSSFFQLRVVKPLPLGITPPHLLCPTFRILCVPVYQKSGYPLGIRSFGLCAARDSNHQIPQSSGLWAAPARRRRTSQFAKGKLQRVPSGGPP